MSDSILQVLNDVYVGELTSFQEKDKNVDFFEKVFVDINAIEDFILNKLLLVGPKGAGKTRILLYIKQLDENRNQILDWSSLWGGKNAEFSFLSLDNSASYPFLNDFDDIAKEAYAHRNNIYIATKNKAYSIEDSFQALDDNKIREIWCHLLGYTALQKIDKIIKEKKLHLKDYSKINDYLAYYDIADSKKIVDRTLRFFSRLKSKFLKIHISAGGNVITLEYLKDLDPRKVLKEIDDFLVRYGKDLYIIIDNPDLMLHITREAAAIYMLGIFFSLFVNWEENYRNIHLRIIARTDLPMRASYGGKDRIIYNYSIISWTKDQFLKLILKRLLYSIKLRKAIDFDSELLTIDIMGTADLIEMFQKLFGKSEYAFSYYSLPYKERKHYDANREIMLQFHEFLYYYFLDGKGSIPLRHIITFLILCKDIEAKRRKVSNIDGNISPSNPLFSAETIEKVVSTELPERVYKQLNDEYRFISGKFAHLARLPEKEFKRDELLETLKGITDTPEMVSAALFYSGIIGGDRHLEDKCTSFYLPAFVRKASLAGGNVRDDQNNGKQK